jgi:alcohol dehydrogenase
MTAMMKAAVFIEPGRIELADKPMPDVGANDALVRITTTTICGTDVHILKGEYPVARGLTRQCGGWLPGRPASDRRCHLP